LAGRKPASAGQCEAVRKLEELGARVAVVQCDVSSEDQLARVIGQIGAATPLRGIVHAAGVLDDGLLREQTWERFAAVMAAKVQGAWNLDRLTRDITLDFFVLFSSAASLLGSPGQGSYAAANAFLDALAHHRLAQGLPALSINWGPWTGTGMAALPDSVSRFEFQGIRGIPPIQGVTLLEHLIQQGSGQVGVVSVNWQRLFQLHPRATRSPLLSHFAREKANLSSRGNGASRGKLALGQLLALDGVERRRIVVDYLREEAAGVLGGSSSKLDIDLPLLELGFDSLMALELKNRVEQTLRQTLPVEAFFSGLSVDQLATQLLERICAESILDPIGVEDTQAHDDDWETLRL
jgi:acyl carrier protein